MNKQAIILTGLSYTGKTVVGRTIAQMLGWRFVDTDDLVVPLAEGRSIPQIFAEWGEARFRGLEKQALGAACSMGKAVIATGGGVPLDAGNRAMMAGAGVVFWLDAKPSTIYQRMLRDQEQNADPVVRPLMHGEGALERIAAMKDARLPYYTSAADWTVSTDTLDTEEVVTEVLRMYGRLKGRLGMALGGVPTLGDSPDDQTEPTPHGQAFQPSSTGAAAVVSTNSGSYPVFVGNRTLTTLPAKLKALGLGPTVYLVTETNVARHYGDRALGILRDAGLNAEQYTFQAGEASKNLDTAIGLYDWLMERRAERRHTLVALGGGVVGDLTGFVAATYLRGMPYVQVPTTLLAMVDASIGGKTGVNRSAAKNLVGSFYQPRMVMMDVDLLRTLGDRERNEGWAEVIKHAFIRDTALLEAMEANRDALQTLEPSITAKVVAASAAIKADVVSQDERESGVRAILNFGHTIGHGLEAAGGYEALLHGEGVAVGMVGAARISNRMGLLSSDEAGRIEADIERFGLPVRAPGLDLDRVRAAMKLDKKVDNARQRWILMPRLGQTVIRDDVPQDMVNEILEELVR